MDNREYWNPLVALLTDPPRETSTGPWQEVEKEECKKIFSMPITQLFDYVESVVSDRGSIFLLQRQFSAYWAIEQISGNPGIMAGDQFAWTLASILYNISRRLDEEMKIVKDIENVKEIMNGTLFTSDYTALSLIRDHMVEISKIRLPKIRDYQSRLIDFAGWTVGYMESDFGEYWEQEYEWNDGFYASGRYKFRRDMYLGRRKEYRKMIRRAQALTNRPQRQRKAPERLNIATNRSKSYR